MIRSGEEFRTPWAEEAEVAVTIFVRDSEDSDNNRIDRDVITHMFEQRGRNEVFLEHTVIFVRHRRYVWDGC